MEEIEGNFPLVHPSIQDLSIPSALAVPTPPTPFYYGVRMAQLQREEPNSDELKIYETATYGETLILILSRFHSEMVYGGRLHLLPQGTIDELETKCGSWDINVDMPTTDIIKAMRYARTIPSATLNTVAYDLPEWAEKEMALNFFAWGVAPFPLVDEQSRYGQYLKQSLNDENLKFVLTEFRRTQRKYSPVLKRLLHRVLFSEIPEFSNFLDQEFGPGVETVGVGRALERLVLRVTEARDQGSGRFPV